MNISLAIVLSEALENKDFLTMLIHVPGIEYSGEIFYRMKTFIIQVGY